MGGSISLQNVIHEVDRYVLELYDLSHLKNVLMLLLAIGTS